MKKLVEFEALNDIMTGGVRINDNFLISEDFLSGSVVRAGFVYDILLNCPNDSITQDTDNLNYIQLKDHKCTSCKNKDVCEQFSNMKFSFFYPNGSFPAPLTTKSCKKCGTKHPIKDIVFCNGDLKCNECKSGLKRMENLKGYVHKVNNQCYEKIKVKHSNSTHTAINYTLHTAQNGALFSIEAISKGATFQGYIDDCDTNLIEKDKIIYVGKYSSNGFGKLKIINISNYTVPLIDNRIKEFNNKVYQLKNKNPEKITFYVEDTSKELATIYLKSDTKLKFNQKDNSIKTLEEYNKIWADKLFKNNPNIIIEKIFAQNSLYGGFDTSKKYGHWKQSPEIVTLKGSSFLISYDKNNSKGILEYLKNLEDIGIGEDTYNGYGQIEVCPQIHSLGV